MTRKNSTLLLLQSWAILPLQADNTDAHETPTISLADSQRIIRITTSAIGEAQRLPSHVLQPV